MFQLLSLVNMEIMWTLEQVIKIIGRFKLHGKSPTWETSAASIPAVALKGMNSSSTRIWAHCSRRQQHPEQEKSVLVWKDRNWRYLNSLFHIHFYRSDVKVEIDNMILHLFTFFVTCFSKNITQERSPCSSACKPFLK